MFFLYRSPLLQRTAPKLCRMPCRLIPKWYGFIYVGKLPKNNAVHFTLKILTSQLKTDKMKMKNGVEIDLERNIANRGDYMKVTKKICGLFFCIVVAACVFAGCKSRTASSDDTAKTNEQKTSVDDKDNQDKNDDENVNAENGEDGENGNDGKKGKTIALAMPTRAANRWTIDSENMQKELEERGYTVKTEFADDDPKKQVKQIEQFIADQVDCIVVTAVDSDGLTDVAKSAEKAHIPVIAYDRLLMDTDAVSFYATFDNKGIGTMIGQAIIEKEKLDDLGDGEYKTIEFFMGSADDNNAVFIYNGLMEALQPYLDDGRLLCKSGRTSFEDTCITKWSQDTAQQWCTNYLSSYYTDEDLDICATAFDGFAYGCKAALLAAGYTDENWPVITGQDCEITACKNILDGTQDFSICKDTRVLAQKCAVMVDAVLHGIEPEINDTEQYNNHVMNVPTYMCKPVLVDKDNLKEVIIDGGYYTESEINEAQ